MSLRSLGLAALMPWVGHSAKNDAENDKTITVAQWQALEKAQQRREPLILHLSADKRGQCHQSLVLKILREQEQIWIDIPYPDLPASFETMTDKLSMSLRRPGAYHHWHIEGFIRERAIANDSAFLEGPYLKVDLAQIVFRQDRRLQPRITFGMERATLKCTLPMQAPVFGELENISAGGVCFNAPGNLQIQEGFYRSGQMIMQAIPIDLMLNKHDTLKVSIQLLAMQVIKKPYLHTRVRARFARLTSAQRQVLAALTAKPALSA